MGALTDYMKRTQRLLNDESITRYNPYDLRDYIDEARRITALEGECIRALGTLTTTANVESYSFSAIGGLPAGTMGVVSVWQIIYRDPTLPPILLESRSWPWFNLHWRTLGKRPPGVPACWAQFQPGLQEFAPGQNGLFYIGPVPGGAFPLSLDVALLPTRLTRDDDPEPILFPWTDCIKFYAAYLAFRESGHPQDADAQLALYEQYMARARGGVTAQILPGNYPGDWRSRAATPAMAATVARGADDFPPVTKR